MRPSGSRWISGIPFTTASISPLRRERAWRCSPRTSACSTCHAAPGSRRVFCKPPTLSLHELDPAVLRAALARAVVRERLCRAVAGARQAGAGDAAGGDRVEDRGGAVAGELLV